MLSRHKRVGLALSIVGGIGLLALLLLPKPESATKSEIASATSNQGVITQGQTGGTNIGTQNNIYNPTFVPSTSATPSVVRHSRSRLRDHTHDPREIPPDQMATFKKELPAFNSNVVMYVECFQLEDQSSCQIAQRYYLLFADYWTVKPITANCHEQHPEKVGLKGRIWLTTQDQFHKGPQEAVDLHKALADVQMNPGYQYCPSLRPNEFVFSVGVSGKKHSK